MSKLRTVTALTLANFGMLAFVIFNEVRPAEASAPLTTIRARALEIVDGQGKLRASLQVIPAGPAIRPDGTAIRNGKTYPEAVVFRLIRPDGRPSVKLATSEQGSGLDLSGGADPTYIVLSADRGNASVTLTNKNGRRKVLQP